jgi:hypothetical protein
LAVIVDGKYESDEKEERNKVEVGESVERGGALAAGREAESRAIRVLSGFGTWRCHAGDC